MGPLDLVKLTPLMALTEGRPEIVIGLIDGPVVRDHPDLAVDAIREVPGKLGSTCTHLSGTACQQGTFVAGILVAKRHSPAPALCPRCSLLIRPIFADAIASKGEMPAAAPEELAQAILDCIDSGARVLNVSAAIAQPSSQSERILEEALNQATRRGVLLVAAAGNQGLLGSTAITRHPWVIPVVAYDLHGRPVSQTNLGSSIGRRGLGAPGDQVTSLGTEGKPLTLGGISSDEEVIIMPEKKIRSDRAKQNEDQPHRVRLPGFITEEEIGLGDVMKRVTYTLGITPCGGCERRATAFNRWAVFTRRRK